MSSRPTTLLRSTALAAALALPLGAVAQTAPAPAAPPTASAAPADPDKVIAKVGGQSITEADLAVAAEDPALALPGTDEKQKRDILVGYVIDLKLGAQAAEAAKLADTPEFKRRLAYMRDKLLVDEYLEQETKKAVSPDAARKLYDETAKTMQPEEEVRARHILVEDEAEAKKVAARVKGGEDFAKVAAEVSKDPGSKNEGGELGFFTKDRMVEPFAEAAFAMKPKEISDPVKSQFGWHVIQVEERRTKPQPTFEELKDQIDQYLTRKAQQDVVLALRKSGKVERLDQPAAATGATPAPGAAQPK
ncbi:peptidylprolyl isomerase [Enterovirga aerilata]|uniref:Parvulin-like PPIase n=1 Tax=Enterovirga aerilata TaxID=2730920 RepID=A0A849IBC1_9HYPH|nr:peptidylprolyl isomerase [Enterovirga sp. DB1703]NNM71233.1 peptidylprolyl isomerase [Enterovirga sp. DB1703]